MQRIFRKKFTWIFTLAIAMLMIVPFAAFADQVVNNIDTSIDNALETATITAGGSATVGLFISVSNGTPSGDLSGCNATGANPASVTLNVPAGVNASATSLNFTGCGVVQNVTFSSNTVNASGYTISVSGVTGGKAGSLWDTTPASFKLIVNPAPPSDTTPPDITPSIMGTLGTNGWYTSDVTVSWITNDDQSAVSSSTGCSPTTVNSNTAGVTFTCTATSVGGTSTRSVTIKLDKTAPSATLKVTAGTPGLNGWYTSDVVISTSGSDSISSPVTCTTDQSQTSDTAGTVFNGSCTNDAGLSTNAAPLTVKLDKTGPSAGLTAAGTLGDNGWYTSNVTINTAGSDSISDPVTCTADQSQTTDTSSATFDGSCTNAAGLTTNAASLTIKRDATAPTGVAGVADRVADHNGWYNHAVGITFSGVDATSGIASCDTANYSGPDSAATSAAGSCTDNAGNVSRGSFDLKYDATGPSAALLVTAGLAGTNGWYISDVTLSTSGSDNVSGPVVCNADQTQTTETLGAIFNGACTNDAGLSTDATPLTVKLDKTAPSATLAVTAGLLGNNGWYTNNVTVHTSGADSISSPITCTADQFQTTDTTGAEFNGVCTNNAGLSTNTAPLTIKRDSTPPTNPVISGVGNYYFGGVPGTASCSSSDVTSALASCTVSGYGASAVGPYLAIATATDNAGNTATATASYSVLAWTLKGFYQPVDMGNVVNTVKNGSTVPMKFEIFAGATELTDVAMIKSTTYKAISCSSVPADDIEVTTTGNTSLRYDTTSGQFIFNWQTPKTVGACLRVTMTTQDGSSLYADFKLK